MELEVAYNGYNVVPGRVQWLWHALCSCLKQSALDVDTKCLSSSAKRRGQHDMRPFYSPVTGREGKTNIAIINVYVMYRGVGYI
jgi:hypothetical protein